MYGAKKVKVKVIHIIIILISFSTFLNCSNEKQIINNLTVEYNSTALGIDVETPRFGWQMQAPESERGVYQTAYQVEVKNPSGDVVWNSGKVNESKALSIKYGGSPLQPTTKYNWTVTVWDQKGASSSGTSWFETGLMNPDPRLTVWSGAKWIGGGSEDLVFYSHYLEIFDFKYTLAIGEGSTHAGFIYGANDTRLMDKNKNIFQVEKKKNESYIKLELDISAVDGTGNGKAKLNVYRVGYRNTDSPVKPIQSFDIAAKFINSSNKNSGHIIQIKSIFGRINISLDGNTSFIDAPATAEKQIPPPGVPPEVMERVGGGASVNLNTMGSGGDVISFGMLCDIGFSVEAGQNANFSDVEVCNNRFPNNTLFKEDLISPAYRGIYSAFVTDVNSGFTIADGKYAIAGGTKGAFIVRDPSKNSTPMLRTKFETGNKKIKAARLYVTARGIYEIYMNGTRVGDDYYNPGLTQYNKTHFYQTYDVTSMLKRGENAVGAMLGEGWWSGLLSFGTNWNYFGDRQSLLAKLVITYDDGSSDIINTNSQKWKYYNKGPIIYSSLDMGEVYDATVEANIKGWSTASFDDNSWKNAVEVPLEGTAFTGSSKERDGSVSNFNYDGLALIGQIGNNAGIYKTLTAQSMKEVRKGVFVYNMGQNFVGVPNITFKDGKAGRKITLRFSEMLYPDQKASGNNVGTLMTENYRAALCQDIYIMKDGQQVFQPHFTSRGYQYVEITGIDDALPLASVKGIAISSILDLTADYKTSNPKVNQLWSNLVWSNVDNFLTIPTDCPQRNERMGWSGDISVFSRTATYVSNSDQFLRRHMIAMRDVQKETGKFTDVAPIGGGFGGVLWGSAGITVPWEVYQQYSDVALLEEHYDAMVAYIDYLETTINPESGITRDGQLGDWLGPQNNMLGTPYLTTAYHVFDLYIMKNVAEVLGETGDAARFADMYQKRKAFFNKTFINEDGKTMGLVGGGRGFGPAQPEFRLADTQTSYAVGLALGAFDDNVVAQMAKNLAETIERKNKDDDGVFRPKYSLMTGFIGTAWVSKALSDNGYNEQAYRLLQNEQYPSWLYSIDQGATSIWERLNGYTVENGFGGNNSMNSFNHYSFGAVGQWMISYSLGIQRDEPGFQKFILQPTPDPTGEMTWAEGYYDSIYGKIYSKWEVKDGQLIYEATVPANTSATLYLPAKSENDVIDSDGCKLIKFENEKAIYQLKSGRYKFTTQL